MSDFCRRAMLPLLTVALQLAFAGGLAPAQAPPAPLPRALPAPPNPASPPVLIRMKIIEVERDAEERVRTVIRERFPKVKSFEGPVSLGEIDEKTISGLVRTLQTNGKATVLSAPQIMTASGQTATVQVGQEVALPNPVSPGNPKLQNLGLVVNCTPLVVLGNERLQLEIDISRTSLVERKSDDADSGKVVGEEHLSTALQLKNKETVVLMGPAAKGALLVLLTTTVSPSDDFGKQVATVSHEKTPSPAALLDQIKKAVGDGDNVTIRELQLKEETIEMELNLTSMAQVQDVVKSLGAISDVQVASIRAAGDGAGYRLQIAGKMPTLHAPSATRLSRPNPALRLTSPVRSASRPEPPVVQLDKTLKGLFPHADVNAHPIQNSVLLRGEVDQRDLSVILRVAEEYFPQVINDLKVRGVDARATNHEDDIDFVGQGGSDEDVTEELRRLRHDVADLRDQVKRAIALLESKASRKPAKLNLR